MAMILVYLYMVTIYIRPQDWVPGLIGLPTAFIIIPLGFALGFINYRREPEKFQMPQNWIMPLYLLVIFISTFVNSDFIQARDQLILFFQRVLVFFMVVWTLSTRERIYGAVWWMLLLSAFLAYQAVLQGTTGASWGGLTPFPGYTEIRVRWYGDWDGPNVFGILFVIAGAVAMELAIGAHGFLARVSGLVLTASYLVAIYFTNSRGAVLAFACAALFYFRNKFRSVFAIGLAFSLIAALFMFGPSRIDSIHSGEASASERTWLWEEGLRMLKENPVWGVGRGEFIKQAELNLLAHNNYVQNFAETGLTGFFLFVALIWFSFKGNMILSDPKYAADPRLTALGHMMTAAIVGYCAATFFVVMELDLFYFFLALCSSVYLVAARENASLPVLQVTRRDMLIITGGMFGLIALIWLAAVKEIM
ncbi:MAG: O-antigen ligase family protein [Sulfuricaulis sp.]